MQVEKLVWPPVTTKPRGLEIWILARWTTKCHLIDIQYLIENIVKSVNRTSNMILRKFQSETGFYDAIVQHVHEIEIRFRPSHLEMEIRVYQSHLESNS